MSAFRTTRWSIILAARDGSHPEASRALADLCDAYWYPLYAFVRSQGFSPDRARDLTQAYFVRLLEREYLQQVRPKAGRFRSFLILAVAVLLAPAAVGANGFEEPDSATERCLAEGEIRRGKWKTLDGVTRPQLIRIECNGEERRAVLKTLDDRVLGVQRFEDGTWEVHFTDSYLYERAAYLLDRHLGLGMVPVAVIREVNRKESALVEWIAAASFERDSPHDPSGRERAELARQKALMRLFDALIYNTDRNTQNLLVDDTDWRLYLIDHSRAFRLVSDLPAEGWTETLARLSPELYERLRALEARELEALLDGLLTKAQIRTLLARRDKIIEKIDRDRESVGDEVVFSG